MVFTVFVDCLAGAAFGSISKPICSTSCKQNIWEYFGGNEALCFGFMDRYVARYYAPRVSTMRLHTPAYTPAKTSINVYFVYSMIAAFLYYEIIAKKKK
jgi:hypothetical protein